MEKIKSFSTFITEDADNYPDREFAARTSKQDYKEIDGLFFHKDAPEEVCKIICAAYRDKNRLRFHWGDIKTGEDWGDVNDITGTVGRSTGSIKVPLLIKTSRSSGGGAILDNACVKIVDAKSKEVLYEHPKYHTKA